MSEVIVDKVIEELDNVVGPTQDQIDDWKAKYHKIYEIEVLDGLYIYRGITRPEVRKIMQEASKRSQVLQTNNVSQVEAQEILTELMQDMQVRMCVIWPDLSVVDFNDPSTPLSLAGVVPTIAGAIDEASGSNAQAIPREL
jgi:hypothetical protein